MYTNIWVWVLLLLSLLLSLLSLLIAAICKVGGKESSRSSVRGDMNSSESGNGYTSLIRLFIPAIDIRPPTSGEWEMFVLLFLYVMVEMVMEIVKYIIGLCYKYSYKWYYKYYFNSHYRQ